MKTLYYILILITTYCTGYSQSINYDHVTGGWIQLKNKIAIDEFKQIDTVVFCGEINCNVEPMKGVDLKTFEVWPGSKYARDKTHVYYPVQISCADFIDCGVCYCSEYILENANPSEFRYLGNDYATDGKIVFFRGKLLKAADGETFKVVKGPKYFYFATDKSHVYKHDSIFSDADPLTFYYDKNDYRNINEEYIHKFIIADKANKWEFTPPNKIVKIAE